MEATLACAAGSYLEKFLMQSDTQSASIPKWMFWTGWVLTVLPALALLMSGGMKLVQPEGFAKGR